MYCSYVEHVNGQQGTGDLYTLDVMGARAPRIAVEDWWLLLARELVSSYPAGLAVLGRDLAREIGRTPAWGHSVLSKFATKKIGATRDLQEAICKKFRLPPPIFFPRTFAEASQMLEVKERHDKEIARQTPPLGSPVAAVHKFAQSSERANRAAEGADSDGDGASHGASRTRHRRDGR